MIVIIVALSYVPGVADHETAFAATQPSSGRTLDAKGDIVLLTTELGRDDNAVQDQVVKLDAETSSVTRLLDFGSLFADYKASATRLHLSFLYKFVSYPTQEERVRTL